MTKRSLEQFNASGFLNKKKFYEYFDTHGSGPPSMLRMHTWARLLAGQAAVEPVPARWPELRRALFFGPQSPASFGLGGPDALPGAAQWVREDAAPFGAIPDGTLTAPAAVQ